MPTSLGDIVRLFLKIGLTAFGGPPVHIAMMEDEVVHRRRWMTREEFLDLVSATNLIPGPNSTEMAIHIGYRQAGFPGLLAAGISFIIPAAAIVTAIAWAYVRLGSLPQFDALLIGIKPVAFVIVIQALMRFGATALRSRPMVAIAVGAAVLNIFGVGEVKVLALAAAATMALRGLTTPRAAMRSWAFPATLLGVSTAPLPFSIGGLFGFFLKVGSVLFGSGYVLLAFLKADLVDRWGWLSEAQLLDAIAIGQVTPGPLFTTATFIGYLLGGLGGATVATVGIFLPAFVFVALSGPLIPRLRRSPWAASALDGLNAASLALMAVVSLQLAQSSLGGPLPVGLALGAAVLLSFGANPAALVGLGALAGLFLG